jgi:nucleotide-binding universal stress UspA family protein
MKILLPLDSSEYAQKNVDYVKNMAKKLDAEVILLNIVVTHGEAAGVKNEPVLQKESEDFLATKKKQLEEEGINVSTKVGIATIAPGVSIAQAAIDLKADLIALGAKGKSLKRNLLIGSVADTVVRSATCSVLVIK